MQNKTSHAPPEEAIQPLHHSALHIRSQRLAQFTSTTRVDQPCSMSTSENASLRFGPMPARTRQPSSSASPASGGPAAGGERRGSGRRGSERRSSAAAGQQQQQQQQPAEVAAWQAECERVKDRLVITADAGGGGGEWRIPLERALASMGSLQATEPEARAELEGAGQALAATAEALAASDKAVSSQLSGLQAEHQAAVAAVDSLQAEQAARQEYVATLEQELQFLNKVGAQ